MTAAEEIINRSAEVALLAACLAGMVIFSVVGIEHSLFLDEANSVLIASRGFSGIVDSLSRDNNLPLFYFLLSLWMRIFGDSEIALRALSAIFYAAGCGVTYVLGKRLSSSVRGGCYAAFVYECCPLAIRHAQNIRMYSLLGLLGGLSTLVYLRMLQDEDRTRAARIRFIAVNALGILTHVWFCFLLTGQAIALLFFARKKWRVFVPEVFAAAVPFLVLWGPIFWGQIHNGATDWIPPLLPWLSSCALVELFGVYPALILGIIGAFAVLVRAFGFGFEKYARLLRGRNIGVLVVSAVAALAVALVVSLLKPIFWPGRYTIVVLAPLASALGALLAMTLPRFGLAFLGTLLMLLQISNHRAHRDLVAGGLTPAQSDKITAQFLLDHASRGDAVVFTSLTRAPADYYFRRAHAGDRFVEVSFPADTDSHLGWTPEDVPAGERGIWEAEAAQTSERLRRIIAGGGKVWLYDGYSVKVSTLLKRKLDVALPPPKEHALEGPYHRRILEYGGR